MSKEKNSLFRLVNEFSGKKIAVWGDFILDEYIYGTTRRISREAPVLIISYRSSEYSLGGAGNSVLNLQRLGAEVLPIGVIGSDASGKKILQILRKKGVTTEHFIIDRKFQTPVKTRILAGEETARKQQVLRIDREEKVADSSALKQKIQKLVQNVQNKVNALLVSDYDYLTVKEDIFRRVLPGFKKRGIPVAVDSRFRLLDFKGATVSTPNEPEVEGALHIRIDDDSQLLKKAGKELLQRSEAAAVLITRGSKGMVLFEKGKPPLAIPIHGTTDIVDVTGAGDTVISVFTLALTCGANFKQAAQLANFAGSVVVMKKSTATLSASELKDAISS